MTYTVGQSLSPETPSHNLIYEEPNLKLFLTDLGDGELSFHADIQEKITLSRIKHFNDIFIKVLAGLVERGVPYLKTYVRTETEFNFAVFFGFEPTENVRTVWYRDGSEIAYHELVIGLEEY